MVGPPCSPFSDFDRNECFASSDGAIDSSWLSGTVVSKGALFCASAQECVHCSVRGRGSNNGSLWSWLPAFFSVCSVQVSVTRAYRVITACRHVCTSDTAAAGTGSHASGHAVTSLDVCSCPARNTNTTSPCVSRSTFGQRVLFTSFSDKNCATCRAGSKPLFSSRCPCSPFASCRPSFPGVCVRVCGEGEADLRGPLFKSISWERQRCLEE